MALPFNNSPQVKSPQARLVLQDPGAGIEVAQPVLRLSMEMNPAGNPILSSQEAQQLWEALQLKPEDVLAQRIQLTQAQASSDASAKQAKMLQAQAAQLTQQMQAQEATRWQHPAVYGAGAVLLGVGFMWFAERKRRLALQDALLAVPNDFYSSVLEVPQGPSMNFTEPLHPSWAEHSYVDLAKKHSEIATPTSSQEPQPGQNSQAPMVDPISAAISSEDLLPYKHPDPVPSTLHPSVSDAGQDAWWKRLKRKSAFSHAGSLEALSAYPSTQSHVHSTPMDLAEHGIPQTIAPDLKIQNYDPEAANVELLAQSRIAPPAHHDAMRQLLEIRMAVQALCALEQFQAAQNLLQQHIDAVPNTCAWAYMQYLELCAQLNQREAFEAMRKRYRLQFNRLAPYWMEPNAAVQTLDTYERPLAELSSAWAQHNEVKNLLTTWLLGTLHARRLFQLPAYHDLLDLYEMLEFYDAEPLPPDWVPTVSLLDLDYEFAIEVKIEAQSEADILRAVPTVKTGDFAVDFNITQEHTQPGALLPLPHAPASPIATGAG